MEENFDTIRIIPKPQSQEVFPGKLEFGREVDVIKPKGFNDALLLELGRALNLRKLNASGANLLVKFAQETCEHKEAYKIQINHEGVLIKAETDSGFYYAIQTLKQLITFDEDLGTFPFVFIEDYPQMPWRGVVEGFYGAPWSHEKRIDQIKYYGSMKMNAYIYAPKDDPYHREKWREAYPETEMERMKQLVDSAKAVYVDFIFALSPGLDLTFLGDGAQRDFQAILDKIDQMYHLGVRTFAIFYDDIHDKSGQYQAEYLNKVYEVMKEKYEDINPLITVPTEYDALGMKTESGLRDYTVDFSTNLNKDIIVLWTGDYIVSDQIDTKRYDEMKEIYGENIGLWWNYPVSDYNNKKLALGPINGIASDLDTLKYFFANPMEHATLSKIALGTSADLSWNLKNYDPFESWETIISHLYPKYSNEVKVWAKHSSQMNASWTVGPEDAQDVKENINNFWKAVNRFDTNNIETSFMQLKKSFVAMVEASELLQANLDDQSLQEGKSSLEKLALMGSCALEALEMMGYLLNQEHASYESKHKKVSLCFEKLDEGMRLSEKTVQRFIEDTLNYSLEPKAAFESTKTVIRPNEEIRITNTSSKNVVNQKWTIFGKDGAEFSDKNLNLSFENEGTFTLQLSVSNPYGHDERLAQHYIHVSHRLSDKLENVMANASVSASSFTNENENPQNVIKVDKSSKWCAVGEGNEIHELNIELSEPRMISQITLYHAEYGNEPFGMNTNTFRIMGSLDGSTYRNITSVKDNTKAVTEHNFSTVKVKHLKLVVEKATQGVENTARIYGVEVLGW